MLLGTPWGIPIHVHWTAPVAAVLFGRLQLVPVFWLAFVGLIIVHELGHAFMVRRARKKVIAVVVDGTGGVCRWRGEATEAQHIAIAWGGVLGQAVVLVIALLLMAVTGRATSSWGAQLERVAVSTNLFIIAFNLLPVGDLDGVTAWRVLPLARTAWRRRWRAARAQRQRTTAAKGSLRELQRLDAVDVDVPVDQLASIVADVNQQRAKRRPSAIDDARDGV